MKTRRIIQKVYICVVSVMIAVSYITWLAVDLPSAETAAPWYAATSLTLALLNLISYLRNGRG